MLFRSMSLNKRLIIFALASLQSMAVLASTMEPSRELTLIEEPSGDTAKALSFEEAVQLLQDGYNAARRKVLTRKASYINPNYEGINKETLEEARKIVRSGIRKKAAEALTLIREIPNLMLISYGGSDFHDSRENRWSIDVSNSEHALRQLSEERSFE